MKQCLCMLAVLMLLASCGGNETGSKAKNTNDTLRISIDESFQPVMAEEIKVFESAYPQTHVIATYKPEADCLRDLDRDSTRVVIISRELSRNETALFDDKLGYKPEFGELAKDAIAVLVNSADNDTTFPLEQLRRMLQGNSNQKTSIAIDGNTATSTVRYLKDSLLRGGAFGSNVQGAKNSGDLMNYIASTPGALGFAGISWLTNPQTKEQEQAAAKVKLCLIECRTCEAGVFAKPSQQTITFNEYPLVRGLYYVLKENYAGVGSRFVEFITTERGQLIFRRALLVPSKMQFNRRTTSIKDKDL